MALSRRSFLTLAGASAAGAFMVSPLEAFYARATRGQSTNGAGFGSLVPDPRGLLDLPPGFTYKAFSKTGDIMSDGNPVPGDHDGMAAFPGPRDTTILVRNHELSPNQINKFGVKASDSHKYDPLCLGGTTTLIVDKNGNLQQDYASIAGTYRNCAGGPTPWGSWISCEENTSTPAGNKLGDPLNVSKKHGYNFEVPVRGRLVKPVPLVAMGRFNHEAVAVDPVSRYIYQTEDRGDSCFYRFRPQQPYNLKAGGILEALVIKGMPTVNTSRGFLSKKGQPLAVEWVKIEDVDPVEDTLRQEAQNKGAAIFNRGEGAWYGNGLIYFVCTSGGEIGQGQIFAYNPADDTLTLVVESERESELDNPDNITVAPFGDLFLCEDGNGEQFIVGVNAGGKIYKFARNAINTSEFAGVCFSPDGSKLFLNIQNPGITFCIQGVWG